MMHVGAKLLLSGSLGGLKLCARYLEGKPGALNELGAMNSNGLSSQVSNLKCSLTSWSHRQGVSLLVSS